MSTHTPIPPQHADPMAPGDDATTSPARHGRAPTFFMGIGAFLVVLAVIFYFGGVPALVRLPLTVDQTVHYTGTFTEYVNQKTLEPLTTPTRLKMTIDRRVRVQSGTFSTAVVTEDDTIRPGPLVYHQAFQFIMNRRGMDFENGPQTMMFGQPAKVDIASTYRVNFPLGTSPSGSYPVWNTETDLSARVSHGTAPHTMKRITGVQVIDFTNDIKGPVSPYYHKWLIDNGFPDSITPTQLLPRLQALGVNVPGLLAMLTPRLTPSQLALVDQVLSSPVPLNYHFFYSGIVAVEPHTGALIWVDTTAEGLKVSPSLTGVDRLRPLLAQYASVPGVQALSSAITTLAAAPPQMAIDYNWVQTQPSSQNMANFAQSQIRTMNIVETIPWVVGGLGMVLMGAGMLVRRRARIHDASSVR